MRLDQALLRDLGEALRIRSVQAFLVLQIVSGAAFIWRRGEGTATTVVLIWMGMLCLAFFAWWAGRHRLAHPEPDPVPGAVAQSAFALVAALGMLVWGFGVSVELGAVLFVSGAGAWLWVAWRQPGTTGLRTRLTRSARPFVPLLLLIAVPRLLVGGPAFLIGAVLALPSGIGQQVLYLLGLYAPLEALRGRSADAAVVSALVFAVIHVPLLVEPNHGDWIAAFANAMLFQAGVGLVACLAYGRHRAAVPIGVAHALAIA